MVGLISESAHVVKQMPIQSIETFESKKIGYFVGKHRSLAAQVLVPSDSRGGTLRVQKNTHVVWRRTTDINTNAICHLTQRVYVQK